MDPLTELSSVSHQGRWVSGGKAPQPLGSGTVGTKGLVHSWVGGEIGRGKRPIRFRGNQIGAIPSLGPASSWPSLCQTTFSHLGKEDSNLFFLVSVSVRKLPQSRGPE